MAAKVNYDELADAIIERLGGKDNISFHTHCVTRLRFNVKDKSLVDKEASRPAGRHQLPVVRRAVPDRHRQHRE